jgi:hypothetical protein
MANYYCLIAGLPDIRLSESRPQRTMMELKDEMSEVLTDRDEQLLRYYFMRFDCENLVKMLEDPDAELDPRGNLTREQLVDLMTSARELNFNVHRYPSFMSIFAREYAFNKDKAGWFANDAMLLAYYEWARECPNRLMSEWYTLNLNIANILTALIARRQGWTLSDFVQGNDSVVETIVNHANLQDFDLGTELDYMHDLMRCASLEDPVEKERQIDALKWEWLEDKTFLEPFGIEALFCYIVRTEMLERWAQLDPETGRQRFTQIIENLRGEAKVPEEFIRK